MTKSIILGLLLFYTLSAKADKIPDVSVLEVSNQNEKIRLKLSPYQNDQKTYFFLELSPADPEFMTKLSHIVKKLHLKNDYVLDLDIKSFTVKPSGSYYKTNFIGVSGHPK